MRMGRTNSARTQNFMGEELRKNKVIVARGQCMEGGGKKVGPPGYFKAMAIVILRQLKATEEF